MCIVRVKNMYGLFPCSDFLWKAFLFFRQILNMVLPPIQSSVPVLPQHDLILVAWQEITPLSLDFRSITWMISNTQHFFFPDQSRNPTSVLSLVYNYNLIDFIPISWYYFFHENLADQRIICVKDFIKKASFWTNLFHL